jgi:hypothetical protein
MTQQHLTTKTIPDGDVPALCVNLHANQIITLTEELYMAGEAPTVQLLADSSQIKDALSDFIVASKVADLVDKGQLDIRMLDEPVQNAMMATESEIVVPLMGDHTVTSADEDVAAALYSEFLSHFEDAENYDLRTPPISKVKSTLREELGDDIADDLDVVLSHADEISNSNEYLDIVEVTILLAARNEILQYDIAKWGEDTGVASKATYSRTKSALEDAGLITTEKVPIDIGRPRLRLIATEKIANADLKTLSTDITTRV